uniref:Uncharacterized protein n=1 Tax=Aegilops tauschii subsp. strangulata TaxID=200361 RepID=A0A453QM85_AEGTS
MLPRLPLLLLQLNHPWSPWTGGRTDKGAARDRPASTTVNYPPKKITIS